MVRKPPKIEHVKHVKRGQRYYSYFNTGQKHEGRPIYKALPPYGSVGFWDSLASFKAGRTRRGKGADTVASLTEAYEASQEFARLSENTRKNYSAHLKKVRETWGKFPVDGLEPMRVRQALDGEGWGVGTRNMVLAVLAVAYKWGRKRGLANIEPTRDVERFETGEHAPWPDDVLEEALKADDDTIRLAVHLLYFTGQRIGDVMKMRWGDIREGHIFVRQTKTGKVVEPPLSAALVAELDRTPRKGITIICGPNEQRLRRDLQAFTAKLGVKTVPHGLRKNAVNTLLEAGCSVAEVASITGQTFQVVEHYAAKVNRRKLGGAAIVKLDAHRRNVT